jgi:hypothetical protein
MKDVIGVSNPFGLVQKAGKRKTNKRKTNKRKTNKRKTRKSMRKQKNRLFQFI